MDCGDHPPSGEVKIPAEPPRALPQHTHTERLMWILCTITGIVKSTQREKRKSQKEADKTQIKEQFDSCGTLKETTFIEVTKNKKNLKYIQVKLKLKISPHFEFLCVLVPPTQIWHEIILQTYVGHYLQTNKHLVFW